MGHLEDETSIFCYFLPSRRNKVEKDDRRSVSHPAHRIIITLPAVLVCWIVSIIKKCLLGDRHWAPCAPIFLLFLNRILICVSSPVTVTCPFFILMMVQVGLFSGLISSMCNRVRSRHIPLAIILGRSPIAPRLAA